MARTLTLDLHTSDSEHAQEVLTAVATFIHDQDLGAPVERATLGPVRFMSSEECDDELYIPPLRDAESRKDR